MFRLLLILVVSTLVACAQTPSKTEAPATESKPAEAKPAAAPAAEPKAPEPKKDPLAPPERVNATPFSDVMLTSRCRGDECGATSDYYSWHTKITFDIETNGELKVAKEQERSLDLSDDPTRDTKCGPKGGTGNQRNPWFPATGIMVRGGDLLSVRTAEGGRQPLLPLSAGDRGLMVASGRHAQKAEYGYVPCVGKYPVAKGHRLSSYLPRGAVLAIKPLKGPHQRVTLPQPVDPYVQLHYWNGAIIPVPMRPTLVTVDLLDHRVVVYYQSTFATSPPLRKLEMRAILPNELPLEGEPQEQFVARINATLQHLRRCPVTNRPMEVCANPNQTPDPRIFAQPKVPEPEATAKNGRVANSGRQ